ncbi:copper transport protein YcnJ precursor [bacterium BMS3Bbin06]|nr:copper transport protein YcnJ precursor [bacterium BMS3Abin08]GBE34885.1 copper transport protein YcnJ precursor [bacterium BMS3Bbin06]HDO35020.1 copper resistance protein CopC [Nitrospirota bacterium]HDY71011.1 copper resistance protein CopC [Nitrospirota bacterium]
MKKILMSVVLLLVVPAISFGHIFMIESTPAPQSVTKKAPEKITITFAGSVERAFSRVEVFDEKGRKVSGKTGFLENDTIMEADLQGPLSSGKYTVKWKCMSLDGHSQKGKFAFTVTE